MIFGHLRNIFSIPELRKKLLVTLGLLVVYRLGTHIPLPGTNIDTIAAMVKSLASDQYGGALQMLSSLSGGRIGTLFGLGIMPYISASIIFSLLQKVIPTLEEIAKEGASGQQKINQWTRYATVPLCLIQSFMMVNMFASMEGGSLRMEQLPSGVFFFTAVLSLTAGTIFLMWIGEQITEYGIGNGISLLIMAGIIVDLPTIVSLLMGSEGGGKGIPVLLTMLFIFGFVVVGVILMSQAQRRIPIHHAKHTRGRRVYGGQKTHMPIRVNMAGVMPVIFASSLMIFPSTIAQALDIKFLQSIFSFGSFWYLVIYVVMIFFFSYFWVSLMFQPTDMAKNMKEHGSFIPGIRAGKHTAHFLNDVMARITFVGAVFLTVIALLPQVVIFMIEKIWLSGQSVGSGTVMGAQFLGGTGILIVVGVILDVVQKLEGHLVARHYQGFLKKGRIKGRMG